MIKNAGPQNRFLGAGDSAQISMFAYVRKASTADGY